jgi:hypothetical protein
VCPTVLAGACWRPRGLILEDPETCLTVAAVVVLCWQGVVVLVVPRMLLVLNSFDGVESAAVECSRLCLWTACYMQVESGIRFLGRLSC